MATVTPTAALSTSAASPSAPPTAPSSGAGRVVGGIKASPLGGLRGDYVFVVKEIAGAGFSATTEIWAIPLDGRSPQLALAFDKTRAGIVAEAAPEIRHLFAPIGDRLVVSGPEDDIVIVELATGTLAQLGVKGWYPCWSRDGRWISFQPAPRPDQPPGAAQNVPTNVIAPTGGAPKALPFVSSAIEWSPSGALLVDSEQGLLVVDPATGAIRSRLGSTQTADVCGSVAFWRRGSPALALTTAVAAGAQVEQRLIVAEDDGSALRILARASGSLTDVSFDDPRWNPASDEVLYRIRRGSQVEIHSIDARSGTDRRIAVPARVATWDPSGTKVVYVTAEHEVQVASRDGLGAQTLLRVSSARERLLAIATVRY